MKRILFMIGCLHALATGAAVPVCSVASPDGRLELKFSCNAEGQPSYAFQAEGRLLIQTSPVGFTTDGPAGPATLTVLSNRSVDAVWRPVWGKRSVVPERFNETTLDFKHFRLVARAYDDGVAFRYEGLPSGARQELTRFNFAGDYTAWFYNGERPNVGPEKLSASSGPRLPVMTVQVDDACYLAIHEADLSAGEPLVLASRKGETSFGIASQPSPAWRVILFGRTPGALVDSHLIELLNPDPVGDFSWVKPGVCVWDWRVDGAVVDGFTYQKNLPSWLRMVDFAAANGMKHLVLDANWYGPEFAQASDPVKGDKAQDVRKLIAYAKEKNVGIWLYLNDVGGRRFPLAQTLAQYGEWGAAGVKYGFMRGTAEEKNARTRVITELCARNKLLCNFHDGPVHPYGQMRTWPNAVTREFCHAQLDARRVFQPKTFVTTVFVNMVAGPLDMNNGMFDLRQGPNTRVDNKLEVPSTLVSEAARTLITFSGATILPDAPEYYQKYPDLLRFIAAQQQPWRESKTLAGVIGAYIVMVRQAVDGRWLIGAATDEQGRTLDLPLDFLPEGRFQATIVQDGAQGHYLTNRETLRTEQRTVTRKDVIPVKMAPGGGACVLLESPNSKGH